VANVVIFGSGDFARIAERYAGSRVAADSVTYLALYPISFVFTAVYSDGLFLALAAWAFLLALDGRASLAAPLGALAVLTRPTGIALLPALAWLLWRRGGSRRLLAVGQLVVLPAALAGYCIYLHYHFGDAGAFVRPASDGGRLRVEVDPADPESLYRASQEEFIAGELDQAAEHLRKSLQLRPDPKAWPALGDALLAQARFSDAAEASARQSRCCRPSGSRGCGLAGP
jgi:tetratricopeptide (TPR) repeat protein